MPVYSQLLLPLLPLLMLLLQHREIPHGHVVPMQRSFLMFCAASRHAVAMVGPRSCEVPALMPLLMLLLKAPRKTLAGSPTG